MNSPLRYFATASLHEKAGCKSRNCVPGLLCATGKVILCALIAALLFGSPALAQDWTHLTPAHSPSARGSTAMARFGDGSSVVLFGGQGGSSAAIGPFFASNNALGDTWLWNGSDWGAYSPPTGSPPARVGATMAYDPVSGNAVLFGGQDANFNFLSDTWVFNRVCSTTIFGTRLCIGPVWSKVTSASNPPGRASASMAYDPARLRIVLNGGTGAGGVTLTDTWEFDPATNSWAKPSVLGTPDTTEGAMAQCNSGGLAMEFGGFSSGQTSNTSFLYAFAQGLGLLWAPFTPSPRPAARFGNAMAYYPVSGQAVLFGGFACSSPDPGICIVTELSDTWSAGCGTAGVSWKQQLPAHSPSARENPGMTTGPNGLTVLLFGGEDTSIFNDTWVWGLRAACLPLDGSEIPASTKINCQFTPAEDIQFGRWETLGFAPPLGRQVNMTFEAVHPGPATIIASWSDAEGAHSETLHYTIVPDEHGH